MRIIQKTGIILIVIVLGVCALSAQNYTDSQLASKAFGEGNKLYEEGKFLESAAKFEEALKLFEKAEKSEGLSKDAQKSELYTSLVNAYFQANDYVNTIKYKKIQLSKDPKDANTAQMISQLYRKKLGDNVNGIKVLVDFDAKYPNVKFRTIIAKTYMKDKDYKNAENWYKKALELRKDGKTLAALSSLYLKTGDNDKAVKILKDYIETKPRKTELIKTYKILGNLYDKMSDNKNAIVYYEKLQTLSYNKVVNKKLVNLYYNSSNFSKTIEKAKKLMKNSSKEKDYGTYMVAMSLYNMNSKKEAMTEFQKLVNDNKYGTDAKNYIKSIKSEI